MIGDNTFTNVLNASAINVSAIDTPNLNQILYIGNTSAQNVTVNVSLIANKGIMLGNNQYINTSSTYSRRPNVSQIGYFVTRDDYPNSEPALAGNVINADNIAFYPSTGTRDATKSSNGYNQISCSKLYPPGIYCTSINASVSENKETKSYLTLCELSLYSSDLLHFSYTKNTNSSTLINKYTYNFRNVNDNERYWDRHLIKLDIPLIYFNLNVSQYIYSSIRLKSELDFGKGSIYATTEILFIAKIA
jgi:hypothetical protein